MTTTTSHLTAELADLLNLTDYPWGLTKWGVPVIDLPDAEHSIRISEEDGTFYVTVLSGGKAQLIHSEMRCSGIAAQVALLATIDAIVADLM